MAAALGALGEGVLVLARTLRKDGLPIVYANAAFCHLSGYTEGELVAGAHGLLHVDPDDRARITRWAGGNEPVLAGESFLRRKDGGMFSAAWIFSRMQAERGGLRRLVAVYRDTTAWRGQQKTQGDTQRMEAVGRLAGGVAHDFNNLISVINGYCEMLAPKLQDRPQALRDLTELHNASRQAAELTRQLLAVGRRQPFDSRVFDLSQFVRAHAAMLTHLLGSAGRLVLELDKTAGAVRTDPAQLRQVLLNLVLNARDALRAKGVVTIRTAARTVGAGRNSGTTDLTPGVYAVLTVSDNGTGMDQTTQERLFEPFFTTKPSSEGTGLGLALVYGVVRQSSGFISVRSELLVGSSFEIMLPVAMQPVEAHGVPPVEAIPALPITRGHETVGVIEADPVLRKMVAGILTSDGYYVVEAADSAEAKTRIATLGKPVQLIILNLDREGEKLAKALGKATTGLRVLNICHHPAPPARSWLPATSQAALPRPFALSELLKAARRLLDA